MECKFYLMGWEETIGYNGWVRCIVARARMTHQQACIRNEVLKTKGFNSYCWEKARDLSNE